MTFLPNYTGLNNDFYWLLTLTVLLVIAIVWVGRKKVSKAQYNYKNILMMLAFFAALICASSAFFSWWTTAKLTPVIVEEQQVSTPYGNFEIADIHKMYFHDNVQRARLSPEQSTSRTKFLIIEEIDKKNHALSEDHYDIKGIYQAIKKLR